MMKINIYIIEKKSGNDLYQPLVSHYIKSAKQFADVQVHALFSKEISKANIRSAEAARTQYTRVFERYLTHGYHVALDPASREVDSPTFANLFKDRGVVNFFIGGAYGLERGFIAQCNHAVSLGKITLSHSLTKIVVAEQIFRGLSILNHHPYHK